MQLTTVKIKRVVLKAVLATVEPQFGKLCDQETDSHNHVECLSKLRTLLGECLGNLSEITPGENFLTTK